VQQLGPLPTLRSVVLSIGSNTARTSVFSNTLLSRVKQVYHQTLLTVLPKLSPNTYHFAGRTFLSTMAQGPKKASPSKKDGSFLPYLGPPSTTAKPPASKCTKEPSSTPMDTEPSPTTHEVTAVPNTPAPSLYAMVVTAIPPTNVSPMEVDQPVSSPAHHCPTPPHGNRSLASDHPKDTPGSTMLLAQIGTTQGNTRTPHIVAQPAPTDYPPVHPWPRWLLLVVVFPLAPPLNLWL